MFQNRFTVHASILIQCLNGIVYSKINLSSLIHHHDDQKPVYESLVEHKSTYKSSQLSTMFGYQQSLKYLLLCYTGQTGLKRHEAEQIMTEFSLLGGLFLYVP